MKAVLFSALLLTFAAITAPVHGGIFGRRWANTPREQPQTQNAQPAYRSNAYRSNSYQPSMPFNSRARPQDWQEAHRGYGVKIRGW
jgi:hypothetical protein